jgi:HEAT repeat protein
VANRDPSGIAAAGISDERTRGLGVFTTDVSLTVQTWDAWLARATGIASEEARGRFLPDVVPGLEERGLLAAYQRVLTQGAVEVLGPALHGYLVPCAPTGGSATFDRMQQRVTMGPLREDDRIVGTITAIEDVTARVEHERALAARLAHDDPGVRLDAATALGEIEPVEGVDPLVGAIGDEDWRVRRAAVTALRQRSTSQVIAAVLEALREGHRDFSVLSSAIELLAAAEVDVIEPLVDLLRDGAPDLRLQAALVLGERGDARAVGPLVQALDVPDDNLRFHAIEALGKLKAAAAVDRLLEIAESGDFFVAFPALEALALINAPGVAPRLAPLIRHDLLRGTVVDVLGRIGDEDTVGPLIQLLNDSGAPTDVVAAALERLHNRYEARYREGDQIAQLVREGIAPVGTQNLLDAVQQAGAGHLGSITRVLGWLEGPAVERALTRLLGNPTVRGKVVEYFVRQGARVVDLLIEQLAAEDLDTRHAAITGLGRIGERRATLALLSVLTGDPALTVAAAGALGRIGDPRAFDLLISLVGDPDASVRQAVIAALNSIGHPDMAARVGPLLRDPHPHLRESAVRIAGYFGYPECADDLLACCDDGEVAVQCAALEHLVFLDDARVVPRILQALTTSPNPRVRASAAQALTRLEVDDARLGAPLLEALADSQPWVRYFAARALGAQRHAAAVGELTRMASEDPAGHVRISAIDALGRIGSPAAIPALSALASAGGSEDLEPATAAIHALGELGGDAVWPPLQSVLRGGDEKRRAAAARAVARVGGTESIELLEWTAASDTAPAVVAAAVRGLGALAADGAAAAIRVLIELAADGARRDLVIDALAALPPPAVESIAGGLRDPRTNVRLAIVQALARMRHADASRRLQTALGDPSSEVRLAALVELRRLGTPGVERRIVELARIDPDPLVRRAAFAALAGGVGAPGDRAAGAAGEQA